MLRDRQTNEIYKRKDIRNLEFIIVEIIELETSLINAQILDLQSSEK